MFGSLFPLIFCIFPHLFSTFIDIHPQSHICRRKVDRIDTEKQQERKSEILKYRRTHTCIKIKCASHIACDDSTDHRGKQRWAQIIAKQLVKYGFLDRTSAKSDLRKHLIAVTVFCGITQLLHGKHRQGDT